MTREDAEQFIQRWQKVHKYEDLIDFVVVEGKRVGKPTSIGEEAVKMLMRYDVDDVQEAGARAELKVKRAPRIAHVLDELAGSSQTVVKRTVGIPEYIREMSANVGASVHGVVVYRDLGGDMLEYGIYEFRTRNPAVHVLQQRFDALGRPEKPEWTIIPPRRIRPGMFKLCDSAEDARLKKRWWEMEQAHQFQTFGPSNCYRPRGDVKPLPEVRQQFNEMRGKPQSKRTDSPQPASFAEAMMPGVAKTAAGIEYTPGENIGKDTGDESCPF